MSDLNSSHRWTVRLPQDTLVLEMLHEVRETSDLRMGDLLEEAITAWYEALPTEAETDYDAS